MYLVVKILNVWETFEFIFVHVLFLNKIQSSKRIWTTATTFILRIICTRSFLNFSCTLYIPAFSQSLFLFKFFFEVLPTFLSIVVSLNSLNRLTSFRRYMISRSVKEYLAPRYLLVKRRLCVGVVVLRLLTWSCH